MKFNSLINILTKDQAIQLIHHTLINELSIMISDYYILTKDQATQLIDHTLINELSSLINDLVN